MVLGGCWTLGVCYVDVWMYTVGSVRSVLVVKCSGGEIGFGDEGGDWVWLFGGRYRGLGSVASKQQRHPQQLSI